MTEEQGDEEPQAQQLGQIIINQEHLGGVWANMARVSQSPYEFTIDFVRMDFSQNPSPGVVTSRVNMSPLFVSQLIDALQQNWAMYTARAMPPEVTDNDKRNSN